MLYCCSSFKYNVRMSIDELRGFLRKSGLAPGELAKLLGITPRAVGLWLSGERDVPGPADAYMRIFLDLSAGARSIELRRLTESKPTMRDGMYAVQYQSGTSSGYATVVLDNGRAYGADPAGGSYDGYYHYDEAIGTATVHLKITFPPNVPAVFAPAQPFEWSVDIVGDVDPRLSRGPVEFTTALGHKIHAQYHFLRELPLAVSST